MINSAEKIALKFVFSWWLKPHHRTMHLVHLFSENRGKGIWRIFIRKTPLSCINFYIYMISKRFKWSVFMANNELSKDVEKTFACINNFSLFTIHIRHYVYLWSKYFKEKDEDKIFIIGHLCVCLYAIQIRRMNKFENLWLRSVERVFLMTLKWETTTCCFTRFLWLIIVSIYRKFIDVPFGVCIIN